MSAAISAFISSEFTTVLIALASPPLALILGLILCLLIPARRR